MRDNKPLGPTADLDIDQRQAGIDDTGSTRQLLYRQPSAGWNTAGWTAEHQTALKTPVAIIYY